MEPKFTLAIEPTFPATVDLHVPGKGAAEVEFTFIARDRVELLELKTKLDEATAAIARIREDKKKTAKQKLLETLQAEAKHIMMLASGWSLDDTFTEEAVMRLVRKCPDAMHNITQKYSDEIRGARLGN